MENGILPKNMLDAKLETNEDKSCIDVCHKTNSISTEWCSMSTQTEQKISPQTERYKNKSLYLNIAVNVPLEVNCAFCKGDKKRQLKTK